MNEQKKVRPISKMELIEIGKIKGFANVSAKIWKDEYIRLRNNN